MVYWDVFTMNQATVELDTDIGLQIIQQRIAEYKAQEQSKKRHKKKTKKNKTHLKTKKQLPKERNIDSTSLAQTDYEEAEAPGSIGISSQQITQNDKIIAAQIIEGLLRNLNDEPLNHQQENNDEAGDEAPQENTHSNNSTEDTDGKTKCVPSIEGTKKFVNYSARKIGEMAEYLLNKIRGNKS